MAASDPTFGVPTPTGTLQGVAAFSWDGAAWQPAGRAGPSVATPTGVLQGVAAFNGGPSWQPSGQAGPGVATPSGVLDGVAVYTWSGSAWTPPGGQPAPSTPSGALRGVAAFDWDGSQWQPAGQAGPDVATPYGVLQGVARFNWTGTAWAAVGAPSLSLDFMTPGALDPRITFTRASTATYFDSSGTMQTAATNVPRWDYDPVTHALRGLLIEEARTNVLLNSATLGTQSVAVTAQAYTLSFYGTGTVTLSGAFAGSLVGTGAFPTRVTLPFTPTAGTLTCTVTGSVLNANLEAGSFATSFVATTAAAVTRAIETCQMPTAPWFTPNAYSLYWEFDAPVSATYGGISDPGFDITTSYFSNSTYTALGATASGSPLTAGTVSKQCASVSATALLVSLSNNGSAAVTVAGTNPAQTGATRMAFGNDPWSLTTAFNGHMRRARYWPRVLSNAELQSVTT